MAASPTAVVSSASKKRLHSELDCGTELEFFTAWFCPYAQRAWIALEHHSVRYKSVEALLPDKPGEEFVGYIKNPRLLELNPKGLVPTLIEVGGSAPVYESLVCVEYIDELAAARMKEEEDRLQMLLPGSPVQRATLRLKADWINKNCCSPFYQILVRKDNDERRSALGHLSSSLDELEKSAETPFLGGSSLSLLDVAFIPWAHRILVVKVLEHYRGSAFALDMSSRPKLAKWVEMIFSLPCVVATLADPAALIATYKRYSDGTAQSQVAEAVRQGKAADTA